jgi:hypothetical protein
MPATETKNMANNARVKISEALSVWTRIRCFIFTGNTAAFIIEYKGLIC